jgi:signal transduction histidine kinase
LVPIRNAAALLRQQSVDADTVRRAADIIDRQVSGMQRLIGDLADVSRMQLGALELRRERAPLSALIDHAIESAGPMVADRGHSLSVSVTTQPIYLYMDVMRLGQALHNIISNASKYTDEQGSIDVSAYYDEARLIISVCDTGIGIPQPELEAIFGLFVQAGQGARVEPGLGLGLYLARHFIEAHHGTVSAASAGPGLGSLFTVSLPCEVAVTHPL